MADQIIHSKSSQDFSEWDVIAAGIMQINESKFTPSWYYDEDGLHHVEHDKIYHAK